MDGYNSDNADSDLETISMSSMASSFSLPGNGELNDELWENLEQAAHRTSMLNSTDVEMLHLGHDKPPVQIRKVIEASAIMLGLQPVKSRRGRQFMIVSLKAARQILSEPDFLIRLLAFASDAQNKISRDGLRALKNYVTDPLMSPDLVERESTTASVLWLFIRAAYAYNVGMPISSIIEERKHERKKSLNQRRAMSPRRANNDPLSPRVLSPRAMSKARGIDEEENRKERLAAIRAKRNSDASSTHSSIVGEEDDSNLPSYMRATQSSRRTKNAGEDDEFYGGLRSPRTSKRPSTARKSRRRASRHHSEDTTQRQTSRFSSTSSTSMEDFKRQMDALSDQFESEMDTAFSMLHTPSYMKPTQAARRRLEKEKEKPKPRVQQLEHASFMESTTAYQLKLARDDDEDAAAMKKKRTLSKPLEWAEFMRPTTSRRKHLENSVDVEHEDKPKVRAEDIAELKWASFMRDTSSSKRRQEQELPQEEEEPPPKVDLSKVKEIEWAAFMKGTESARRRAQPDEKDQPKKAVDLSKVKEVEWAPYMKSNTIMDYRSGKKSVPKSTGWSSATSVDKVGGIMGQFEIKSLAAKRAELAKFRAKRSKSMGAHHRRPLYTPPTIPEVDDNVRRSKTIPNMMVRLGVDSRSRDDVMDDLSVSSAQLDLLDNTPPPSKPSTARRSRPDVQRRSNGEGEGQASSHSKKKSSRRSRPQTARTRGRPRARTSGGNSPPQGSSSSPTNQVPRAFREWERKKKEKDAEKLKAAEMEKRKKKRLLASIRPKRNKTAPDLRNPMAGEMVDNLDVPLSPALSSGSYASVDDSASDGGGGGGRRSRRHKQNGRLIPQPHLPSSSNSNGRSPSGSVSSDDVPPAKGRNVEIGQPPPPPPPEDYENVVEQDQNAVRQQVATNEKGEHNDDNGVNGKSRRDSGSSGSGTRKARRKKKTSKTKSNEELPSKAKKSRFSFFKRLTSRSKD